jgi:kynurenine formamidase
MTTRRGNLGVGAVLATIGATLSWGLSSPVQTRGAQTPAGQAAPAQPSNIVPGTPTMTAAEYDALFQANNNWGRWGKDDRLGTANLITQAKRKQAAALVKEGLTVSIGHDLSTEMAADNPSPMQRVMAATLRLDVQTYNYHGGFTTHIDALCHYLHKGQQYNGFPARGTAEGGCIPGIENVKNGIVTRGILIDIPRLKGVPYLEPGAPIYIQDVEAWEKKIGVKVGPGDALVLRTGRWARRAALGPERALNNAAGFHVSVGPWVKARDVAIAGGDVSVEVQTTPPLVEGMAGPLHTLFITGLGMTIIDNFDTEALAETAARLKRWEFMLMIAPLRVPGGTGSPVNPLAVF